MIGAIIGDIAGSVYESSPQYPKRPVGTKNFNMFYSNSRFTDDTVLTCAIAETILSIIMPNSDNILALPNFAASYKMWAVKYPDRGYGGAFKEWVKTKDSEYYTVNNSYANGCMMRCSPIAMYYSRFPESNMDNMYKMAISSIQQTHNSPESERGVKSITSAIWMARHGKTKQEIKAYVEEQFGHMLDMSVEDARAIPKTSIRCNVTAPQALVCFMESTDYESAIRNAIYLGGDTDTNAAIAGSIAEAFYGTETIPTKLIKKAKLRLNDEIIELVNRFYVKIGKASPL